MIRLAVGHALPREKPRGATPVGCLCRRARSTTGKAPWYNPGRVSLPSDRLYHGKGPGNDPRMIGDFVVSRIGHTGRVVLFLPCSLRRQTKKEEGRRRKQKEEGRRRKKKEEERRGRGQAEERGRSKRKQEKAGPGFPLLCSRRLPSFGFPYAPNGKPKNLKASGF